MLATTREEDDEARRGIDWLAVGIAREMWGEAWDIPREAPTKEELAARAAHAAVLRAEAQRMANGKT